jgi:hypothetical protein
MSYHRDPQRRRDGEAHDEIVRHICQELTFTETVFLAPICATFTKFPGSSLIPRDLDV